MQLAKLITRAATRWPDADALIGSNGSIRSWSQTANRIQRLAGVFQVLGVQPGDRIGLLALNSERYFECLFAAFWADAVIVPMNTRWSLAENLYCVTDSTPTILLIDEGFRMQAEAIQQQVDFVRAVVFLGETEAAGDLLGVEALMAYAPPAPVGARGSQDLAGIFYTGGTTGFPKGVMLSHASLLASSTSFWFEVGEIPRKPRYLHAAPMFHLADASQSIGVTVQGGAHAFLGTFDPLAALEMIGTVGITDTVLVPTMLQKMVDHPRRGDFALDSLQRIIYGGSPMPLALLDRVQAAVPHVQFAQCYGQTEMAPVISVLNPDDHGVEGRRLNRIYSVGRPAVGVDLRIVDCSWQPLPSGQTGQILARGNNAMLGYWNRAEATQATFVDGWIATGDAGYLDEDGYLHLVDRVKDMIISGGENVYSVEVENALCSHPQVRGAAVIGIPSDVWGETVHAIVVPEVDAVLSTGDLIGHCRTLIAGYKCPKSVEFVSELPISAAGKVLKEKLRAPHWEGRKRIN